MNLDNRSTAYLRTLETMDLSGSSQRVDTARLAETLQTEFDERWSAVPLGWVGHCYLGAPYETHTLTPDGQIIEHYEAGVALPGPLDRARKLATLPTYVIIEVYEDRLICVRKDGSVIPIEGDNRG